MENNTNPDAIIIFMTIGIVVMLLLALSLVLFFLLSQRKLVNEKIKAQAVELQHQQALLEHNLTVQEAERQRIAAQLHDDIGSKLGVLHLTFHRLRKTDTQESLHTAMYEEVNSLITNTLDATRRISHELLPPTLEDFGLGAALEELCESIRKTGAIAVEFDSNMQRNEIGNPATELNLFRIVQELTNNTLKYAHASQIHIRLWQQDGQKRLTYTDNGQGFDPAATSIGHGLGMKNLENRAKMLRGSWQIRTAPGQGFEAIVDFK